MIKVQKRELADRNGSNSHRLNGPANEIGRKCGQCFRFNWPLSDGSWRLPRTTGRTFAENESNAPLAKRWIVTICLEVQFETNAMQGLLVNELVRI